MEEDNKLARWMAGEMTGEELSAFENSPEFPTYVRIRDVSAQLSAPAFDENKIYNNVLASKEEKGRVININRTPWLRIAAMVVVFLSSGYLLMKSFPEKQVAENSEVATFSLPDASTVVLNAGSEITYKKWGWESDRELELDGEAYFKVAKGKTFTVSTDLGTITVLGTQFNVRARDGRLDVTCFEGRVKVSYQDKDVVITKGQNVAFANGGAIEVPQHSDNEPDWINNEISFTHQTLAAIISELERQYDIAITLKAPQSQQLFTGTLPMKNLDEALEIIEATYHLNAVKSNKEIILESVNAN